MWFCTVLRIGERWLQLPDKVSSGSGNGRYQPLRSQDDPAFQACQYLLPATLPGAGQWRAGRVCDRSALLPKLSFRDI
jgi:hypothetical protein